MSFIEDLYYGNIQPYELPPYDSEKYKTALRTFAECEEELEKTLSGNERALFLKLINAHEVLLLDSNAGNFAKGCRFTIEFLRDCFNEEW